jgi:hypothetical protein
METITALNRSVTCNALLSTAKWLSIGAHHAMRDRFENGGDRRRSNAVRPTVFKVTTH